LQPLAVHGHADLIAQSSEVPTRPGKAGRICMHRKKINISYVLAGQRVGIKEVDDGIWIVSFTQYDLGYIDLEQKTLQPLDNPFGARLLPMS
jgi:hypothetical protein